MTFATEKMSLLWSAAGTLEELSDLLQQMAVKSGSDKMYNSFIRMVEL